MVPEQVRPVRTLPRRRAAIVLLLAGSVLLSACSVISSLQADPTGPGGGQFIIQCETPIRLRARRPDRLPARPRRRPQPRVLRRDGDRRVQHRRGSPQRADRLLPGRFRRRSRRHGRVLAPDALHRWPPRPGDEVDLLLQRRRQGGRRPGVPAGAQGHRRRHDGDGAAGRQDRLLGCGNDSSISKVESPPRCGDGELSLHVIFPDCWNGR